MFKGKKCRVHLEEVLQNNFKVRESDIKEATAFSRKKKEKRNLQTLATRIEAYQQLVHNHAEAICRAGVRIFQ